LLGDLLGRGSSSRLYQRLVKDEEIFTSISSFVMGSIDPGLLVVSGRVKDGILLNHAEEKVEKVIAELRENIVADEELGKVKTQAESILEFSEVEVINRAMNLAFAKLSGDANLVNDEVRRIEQVSTADIKRISNQIFREENSSVLYYQALKN